jgi:hypothetical protein
LKAQQLAESVKFTKHADKLHNEVTDIVSRQRRKKMEAHNANKLLVQPIFDPGEYVLRAEPKRVHHKLSLIWKGLYQVVKVYDNNTLRVSSLISGAQFSTHVTRTHFYKDAIVQSTEDIEAAAHFNSTIQFVIDKFGAICTDKSTGEICVFTSWLGFDKAENTVEPIHEKWIVVPGMLNKHLQ